VENWGAPLYGNPCRQCGFDWSISSDGAVDLIARVPVRYVALLANTDGSQRHPDLDWSAVAYVCHVTDNLRIWAERLAGAALGGGLRNLHQLLQVVEHVRDLRLRLHRLTERGCPVLVRLVVQHPEQGLPELIH